MKVKLDYSIEVSDEQRTDLANVLDGKVSRRHATREECRAFIWEKGESWKTALADLWHGNFGADDDDEDLLGVDEDTLEDLL